MVDEAPGGTSAASGYNSLFEQYIAAGMAHSLQSVGADRYRVPEDVRVQAWHLLSFALRTPRAWPVTANLLLALSPKMQQAGFREQWLAYLEQGLACSQAAGDFQSTATLELEIGELLRHLGRIAEAEDCFYRALYRFEAVGDVVQTAAAKVCLANLAFLREKWLAALAWCQEAVDAIPGPHYVRARALFVAAETDFSRHDYAQAGQLYQESKTIWEALGERRWSALCLQNQARLAAVQQRYDMARDYYQVTYATFLELDIPHSQAVVQMNWGIVEYLAGNLQPALALYRAAESIFRRLGDTRHLAMVCNNIGLVYRNLVQGSLNKPTDQATSGLP